MLYLAICVTVNCYFGATLEIVLVHFLVLIAEKKNVYDPNYNVNGRIFMSLFQLICPAAAV